MHEKKRMHENKTGYTNIKKDTPKRIQKRIHQIGYKEWMHRKKDTQKKKTDTQRNKLKGFTDKLNGYANYKDTQTS